MERNREIYTCFMFILHLRVQYASISSIVVAKYSHAMFTAIDRNTHGCNLGKVMLRKPSRNCRRLGAVQSHVLCFIPLAPMKVTT